jgi:hypothetical protein
LFIFCDIERFGRAFGHCNVYWCRHPLHPPQQLDGFRTRLVEQVGAKLASSCVCPRAPRLRGSGAGAG